MSDPSAGMRQDRDLVLPQGQYAYVLDSTKGKVQCYVGPYKTSLANTDIPVVWDQDARKFRKVADPDAATLTHQEAGEGQYIVLSNPAVATAPQEPPKGNNNDAVDLQVGRQVNIPGPVSFPLWPGQNAQTIDGHHLRHNQYLIVRVYDPEAAAENWDAGVIATQGDDAPVVQTRDFAMGQLRVIKGTEVSFYIPPTGIEVVPEGGTVTSGRNYGGTFVREAVTLERLEYCILLDEDGEKRYVQGPAVVFPEPTESFVVGFEPNINANVRKFTAIELNPHSGLFVKVVDAYEEHPVGEELFITGDETPIYFPRAEHSIIQYGSKRVHHAVAIPAGEGRYVLDRDEGTVDLVRGPRMYLPDPRKSVVVLRILDPHIVELLYPGNHEARAINERYQALSSRLGGEHLSNADASADADVVATLNMASTHTIGGSDRAFAAETMKRGTTYTPPRTIVLDTKYEGAVTINIWPGYAVLVVDKTDNRRVEVGPKAVMLEYDEVVMPLTLSTGTPKNDINLLRTGYLRIVNNQVSDSLVVETRDLVTVRLDVSYRVNFEGDTQEDRQKWFAIENYVKVLTDHARSRLRNTAKRHGIQEFYTGVIDIVRDTLLGAADDDGREGLFFQENNMRLYDVEILGVHIADGQVGALMIEAQTTAITGAIELSSAQDRSARFMQLEELKRADLAENERTLQIRDALAMAVTARQKDLSLAQIESEVEQALEQGKITDVTLATRAKAAEVDLEISQAQMEQELQRLVAETTEQLRLVEGIDEAFIQALTQFGDKAFVETLVKSMGPAAYASGVTAVDLFHQAFKDTPFEGMMANLAIRPFSNGQREVEVTSS